GRILECRLFFPQIDADLIVWQFLRSAEGAERTRVPSAFISGTSGISGNLCFFPAERAETDGRIISVSQQDQREPDFLKTCPLSKNLSSFTLLLPYGRDRPQEEILWRQRSSLFSDRLHVTCI